VTWRVGRRLEKDFQVPSRSIILLVLSGSTRTSRDYSYPAKGPMGKAGGQNRVRAAV